MTTSSSSIVLLSSLWAHCHLPWTILTVMTSSHHIRYVLLNSRLFSDTLLISLMVSTLQNLSSLGSSMTKIPCPVYFSQTFQPLSDNFSQQKPKLSTVYTFTMILSFYFQSWCFYSRPFVEFLWSFQELKWVNDGARARPMQICFDVFVSPSCLTKTVTPAPSRHCPTYQLFRNDRYQDIVIISVLLRNKIQDIKYFCKIVAWHSTLCWRLKMFCCWDLDPTQYLWLLKQQISYPIQDERRNYGLAVNQTWNILSVNLNVSCVDIVMYEYDKVW